MADINELHSRTMQWYHQADWKRRDTSGSSNKSGSRTWSDARIGVDNPKYKDQIAKGQNATTEFSGRRVRVFVRPFFVSQTYEYLIDTSGFNPLEYREDYGTYIIPIPKDSDVDDLSETVANNMAKTRFVQHVRSEMTTLQGGVFIAELAKTVRFIKNPVRALRSGFRTYFKSLKKSGGRRGFSALSRRQKRDIITDTWLEHSFAWKPLVHDVDDAVHALADHQFFKDSDKPKWKMIKGFGEETSVIHDTGRNLGGSSPSIHYEISERSSVKVKYYGQVDVGSSSVYKPRRVGFDTSNFLPTAWEVLPWSFLIDYFSNIQDIVSAVSLARTTLRWTSKTIIREITHEMINQKGSYSPDGSAFLIHGYMTPGKSLVSHRSVLRDSYSGSLVPSLEISIPTSIPKLLNVAALLVSGRLSVKNYR